MTYSILGHCKRTDQVGIALTTVTLAGGGTTTTFCLNGGIVVVQAFGNLQCGIVGAQAIDAGCERDEVLERMRAFDADFDHRQVGIMPRDGAPFGVTGPRARPHASHIVEDDFIAMGNVVVGPHVVEAMAGAFRSRPDDELAERLMCALEAGRDAGGQKSPDNQPYNERSALLRVLGDGPERRAQSVIDLRTDMTIGAVGEMRRMYEIYKPVIARRNARAADPSNDPSTPLWEARHMADNPPPPALKEPPVSPESWAKTGT